MSSRGDRPRDAAEQLAEIGTAIADAVDHLAGPYLVRSATRVLDAWHGIDPAGRPEVDRQLALAADEARLRVGDELRALLARPAHEQATTPLEVVRSLPREPTAVLAAAGVPPVVRDAFDERAQPDDRYGLAPRSLADLGEEDLGPLHLAWGLAKTRALRESL